MGVVRRGESSETIFVAIDWSVDAIFAVHVLSISVCDVRC